MDPGLMPDPRRVTRRHGLRPECRLKLTDPSLNCRQQGDALVHNVLGSWQASRKCRAFLPRRAAHISGFWRRSASAPSGRGDRLLLLRRIRVPNAGGATDQVPACAKNLSGRDPVSAERAWCDQVKGTRIGASGSWHGGAAVGLTDRPVQEPDQTVTGGNLSSPFVISVTSSVLILPAPFLNLNAAVRSWFLMSVAGPIATLLEIERLVGRGDPIVSVRR